MKSYQDMLNHILSTGVVKEDRTGVGTISTFGYMFRHNLREGFPLLTTKKIFTKGVIEELLWFLRGERNIRSLQERGVNIWNEWADSEGDVGPTYGVQWRNWSPDEDGNGLDQINQVIDDIRSNPNSRRHIVTAWNPHDIPHQGLPCCHILFQFNVTNGFLSCHMYQRSADAFLGVPFNIASYALLTHMIAQQTNLNVGDLIISFGDLHIYLNHLNQVRELLSRSPRSLPMLALHKARSIDVYERMNVEILGYDPHPTIEAPIAV